MNKRITKILAAAAAAIAIVLVMGSPAQAGQDVTVTNGYAYGGFINYGDDFWVEHYEGEESYVEWWTDYGRQGVCGYTNFEKTCNENLAEGHSITIQVCTFTTPRTAIIKCSRPVTGII